MKKRKGLYMVKHFMASAIIFMTIMSLQPEKPQPKKVVVTIGQTTLNSVFNKNTGLWEVTWRNPQLYFLSVSMEKAFINFRF